MFSNWVSLQIGRRFTSGRDWSALSTGSDEEGRNTLIDLQSRTIIDMAKARAEANAILNAAETDMLNKVRALQDLANISRLERQATSSRRG